MITQTNVTVTPPPAPDKSRQFRALSVLQRANTGPTLVLFKAAVESILQIAEVGELGPDSRGPQREKNDARVQAISKFFSANELNTVPTAVILAFSENAATFAAGSEGELGTLTIVDPATTKGSIVDGQHRLSGIEAFNPKTEMAVVALLNADQVEKAFQFLVINNKSSKVPVRHTKSLLAKMKGTQLAERLKSARLSFDVEGIKDVDLVNSDPESPFFKTIDWTTTPEPNRMVQATAIEQGLEFLGGLTIPEFEDRDVRRAVFLVMWKTIKSQWPDLWMKGGRLVSKVGIVCLTRFIADLIAHWADSDDLNIEITDLEQIEKQTKKILLYLDARFWITPWADNARGGFDTAQGRDRVVAAITQVYRNGRREIQWYTDIDILDPTATTK